MRKYIYIEPDLPVIHGAFSNERDNEFIGFRKIIADFANEPTEIELEKYIQTNYPPLIEETIRLSKLADFRVFRAAQLAKYDILRQGFLAGDYDTNGVPYPALSEEEKQYRLALLNFPPQITDKTTELDYPQAPVRLR